jgi:hypothetical protein
MKNYLYFGKWREFSRDQQKSYTTLGLSLFSLVIFGAFAIRPSLATVLSLTKSVDEGEKMNLAFEEKIASLSLLEQNINQSSEDVPLVFRALPESSDVSPFLKDLSLYGGKIGVGVERINVLPDKNLENGIKGVPVSLRLTGAYPGLLETLTWLETSIREKRITEIVFRRGVGEGEDGETAPMTLDLEMLLLYYPPKGKTLDTGN